MSAFIETPTEMTHDKVTLSQDGYCSFINLRVITIIHQTILFMLGSV